MTCDQSKSTVLRNVRIFGDEASDLVITDGRISTLAPAGTLPVHELPSSAIDLEGYVLFPAAAEPHAHLDKALLGSRVANATEDLNGAVRAIIGAYDSMKEADVEARASAALRQAIAHGYTAVRTHVDCRTGVGARNVRVLARLREAVRPFIDLQIVALSGALSGPEADAERALLEESMRAGADAVGGAPALDQNPAQSMQALFTVAADFGASIDLHVDETLDTGSTVLRDMAEHALATGFAHPITASHCVSLSTQSEADARSTAALVAAAGISVVALPQTNLYLQGREARGSVPRGIPPLALLDELGVTVAAGGDNWRDPFNPMGRIDPLETASLLVAAGHDRVRDAVERVTASARRVMGLDPIVFEPGGEASMFAVRGESLTDAVGRASEDRLVIVRGQVLARTSVVTEFAGGLPLG